MRTMDAMKTKKHVQKKTSLTLVVDLDETLLNSIPTKSMRPEEVAFLAQLLQSEDVDLHIPDDHNNRSYTKLRPFVHQFLKEVSTMFQLYVYTMSARAYALPRVRLLDPTGTLFGDRIITRDDLEQRLPTSKGCKDISLIPAPLSKIVILDDCFDVWRKHPANLVLTHKYHFFRSPFETEEPLVLCRKDESIEDGILANLLKVLRAVHCSYITRNKKGDVRKILRRVRLQNLKGCKLAFAELHNDSQRAQLKSIAKNMGAQCVDMDVENGMDESVTHVVTCDRGGDMASRWATQHHCHVVSPTWIIAAFMNWKRPAEDQYLASAGDDGKNTFDFCSIVDLQVSSGLVAPSSTFDGHESAAKDIEITPMALRQTLTLRCGCWHWS